MILIPALLKSFRSLVDGSITVSFDVNNTDPDTMSQVAQSLHKVGYLGFKLGERQGKLQEIMENMPEHDFENGKTKSQRLRAVLYRLWEQKNQGYDVFDDFYNARMELLINQIKNKLDT